jgi:membrane-bound metal-dependent hydrolase YbcI (DUF457 family)
VTLAVLRLAPGWVALVLAAFLAAMAARAVEGLRWQTIAGVAGAVTWAASTWAPGMLGQLPAAVMAGCLLHLLGDLLTPEGVPPLWPCPWRARLPLIGHTGGWGETFVACPLLGLLVAVLVRVRPAGLGWT